MSKYPGLDAMQRASERGWSTHECVLAGYLAHWFRVTAPPPEWKDPGKVLDERC